MPSTTERVIADRYRLRSSLGRGAMGTVWLAEDALLKRRVAVKEIDIPPSYDGPERVSVEARLLREARAAARLGHPGAVSVYDVIEHGDRPWIVMEYVDAPTLAELVERDGGLSPEAAARIGLDLLSVLETAHVEGIVHRDVKPANVMVTEDGRVKLADFGIASIQDDPKITQTGLVLGSPAFMAPEQAQSGTSGPEADLWSLGATLYQAVEGAPPFDKGSALPTLTAVLSEEPRPMRRAGDLGPVISALLRKNPSQRPSAVELRDLLERVVGRGPATGATTARASVGLPATAIHDSSVEDTASPPPRSGRVLEPRAPVDGDRSWVLWALLAVGIAALIALPMLLGEDGDRAGRDRDARAAQPNSGEEAEADDAPAGVVDGSESESGSDPSDEGPSAVPADWETYEDESAGYTLQHPPTWVPRARAGNRIDFTDPTNGTYIRVEWTDAPGDDVMARLEEIADDFRSRRAGYEQHQLTATEYRGYPAGLWEYSYEDGGAALRAYNLQFVIEDEWGFALNFQTRESAWSESQDLWEALKAAFQPPE